jgi:O-antigen ligase
MLIQLFLRYPLLALLLHVGLGFLSKAQPAVVAALYMVIALVAILEIVATRDKDHLTAYYGLYLTGFEVLSRMSKSALFWEIGKYSCIAVFGVGSIFSLVQKKRPYLFFAYLILLLPGILVSAAYGGADEERIRDLVSQYFSGPVALLAAGWYFYQRPMQKAQLAYLIRVGILPSVAVVTLLFLGKSLLEIDFIGGSNFEASGGFGPNQVSSALGWAIVLAVAGLLLGLSPTGYRLLDYSLLTLLVFRGLLTFSRGGMMGAFGAIGLSVLVLFLISGTYRTRMKKLMPRIVLGSFVLLAVAFFANDLTGNFLLYRYQGKSTSDVVQGRSRSKSEYLSGREEIMESELSAFVENPVLGIGIGRGTLYREASARTQRIASHTEFTRMLGEHGLLGLLAIVCVFMALPYKHFRQLKNDDNRLWMMVLFILSMFTLAHSGMRMALPSVAFGLAFLWILKDKKPD